MAVGDDTVMFVPSGCCPQEVCIGGNSKMTAPRFHVIVYNGMLVINDLKIRIAMTSSDQKFFKTEFSGLPTELIAEKVLEMDSDDDDAEWLNNFMGAKEVLGAVDAPEVSYL